MAGKAEIKDIEFSGDWKAALAKLKLRDKTPFKFQEISASYKYSYSLLGEAKMSPTQARVFDKLVHAKADRMKEDCVKKIQGLIAELEGEVDTIRKKRWLKEHIEAELDVLNQKQMKIVEKMIKTTNEQFEGMIDKHLKQFVKGKHHRKKKIQQTVKHVVRVPVAVAAIPIAAVASTVPFIAPVSLIALKGSIIAIKQAATYGVRHAKGMEDLARRIKKNIGILEPRALEYADLVDKIEKAKANGQPYDAELRKLRIVKQQIEQEEIVGYAFKLFLDVHAKTISNLEGLMNHYRRKVNKQIFVVMDVGRRIDKFQDEINRLEKKIDKTDDLIATYPKILADMHVDSRQIDKCVNRLKAQNAARLDTIDTLKDEIRDNGKELDSSVEFFLNLEKEFEGWAAKVQWFKSQRPKSVKNWKRAVKALAFTESMAEAGFSFGSNFSTADGLVTLTDTAAKALAAEGTLADLGNNIQGNAGDIKQLLKAG